MSLSGVDNQIKTSYEVNGMSPEEIAEDQSFSLTAVKAKLMQVSSKYRKDCGQEDEDESELNFSNEQLKEANKIIFESALSATHPDGSVDFKTRLNASIYIREDKKGRKDIKQQIQGTQFNILNINEMLLQAREKASTVKQQRAIEV